VPTFDGAEFPDGAVCANDAALYTSAGYSQLSAGQQQAFGDYCVTGPAYVYYHENGQFQGSGGRLASAIAPAQGNLPTYDVFFSSVGAQLPIPDLILFHNPGTGEGAALKISRPRTSPCVTDITGSQADPICVRDSFYYVGQDDIMSGSRQLGSGSGRRVPNDIQGTGCECNPLSGAYQRLAPSRVNAAAAMCDEFLRGGRIDYAFYRIDDTPVPPQLVWRVTDASGSMAHDYDTRTTTGGG
jgi:hypothetical protein